MSTNSRPGTMLCVETDMASVFMELIDCGSAPPWG